MSYKAFENEHCFRYVKSSQLISFWFKLSQFNFFLICLLHTKERISVSDLWTSKWKATCTTYCDQHLRLEHLSFIDILYMYSQAPVPLSIFRSNSKFDENSKHSSVNYTRPITTIFCTRHDSVTVVTCAKYRCDRSIIFGTRAFWIFIEFDRNMLSGTGARSPCNTVWYVNVACCTAMTQMEHGSVAYLSRLPWTLPGAPLKVNEAPRNIQDNLDSSDHGRSYVC